MFKFTVLMYINIAMFDRSQGVQCIKAGLVEGYFAETAAVFGNCHFLRLNLGVECWG